MGGRRRGIEMDEEPESPAAVPAPAADGDLELPEVDFSFAGLAEDDYSFASADGADAADARRERGEALGSRPAPASNRGASKSCSRAVRAPATAANTRPRSTPGRGSS